MSKVTVIATTGRLLDTEYKRPKITKTESIQNKKDIEERLKDYKEIKQKELCMVPLNSSLRYIGFDKKKKKELFRFGGLLISVKQEYVILAGKGGKTFSAQRYTYDSKGKKIHTTRFFKKMNKNDILENQLNDTINQSNAIFKKQSDYIEEQRKEIKRLKEKLDNLSKKIKKK